MEQIKRKNDLYEKNENIANLWHYHGQLVADGEADMAAVVLKQIGQIMGFEKKDDDVGHNDDDLDHKSDEDDVEVFMENDFSHEADVDVQKDLEKD